MRTSRPDVNGHTAVTEADGRRVFAPEFQRTVVQKIRKGEKTLAELSRGLDISPAVLPDGMVQAAVSAPA